MVGDAKRVVGAAALLLLSLLPGCNNEYPNPFPIAAGMKAPPRGAALVYTSGAWSSRAGAPREVFSIGADGTNPTRLTFCNDGPEGCDTAEASLAPEGKRAIQARAKASVPGFALITSNLERGVEGELLPAAREVNSVDWAAAVATPVIVYSALGEGNLEDLWRADPDGANTANLTSTPNVRELHGRVDPGTSIATFERIEGSGKAEVFVFLASNQQVRITPAGPGGAPLPGTPYLLGSDADPAFSADSGSVVFRRLTSVNANGGTWDVLTARANGTETRPLAAGPQFRGAPDWGPLGIVFPEVDVAAGTAQLILIRPSGERVVLLTQGAGFVLSNPRWLRQVAQ
jgi:hypothetical protein